MYNSSNFKCQLSFNLHLNLNKVCATQSWILDFFRNLITAPIRSVIYGNYI